MRERAENIASVIVIALIIMIVLVGTFMALQHFSPHDEPSSIVLHSPAPMEFPVCMNRYVFEGSSTHDAPCSDADLGYIDATGTFHFMPTITPEERDQTMPHIKQHFPSLKFDSSRCNECSDEDEGHPLHAGS